MNRKGQMTIGLLVGIFLVIIVGLVLMDATADHVGTATATATSVNVTYTVPAVNATIDLTGQELIDTPVIYNATAVVLVANGNFTIDEGVSATTGLKSIQLTTNDFSTYPTSTVNISYTYGPDGYIDSAGGRSLASLILIFFALGIAVLALIPTVRSRVLEMVK